MQVADSIKTGLEGIRTANDIERQRASFGSVTNQLLDAVRALGIDLGDERDLYLEFCPMATDSPPSGATALRRGPKTTTVHPAGPGGPVSAPM